MSATATNRPLPYATLLQGSADAAVSAVQVGEARHFADQKIPYAAVLHTPGYCVLIGGGAGVPGLRVGAGLRRCQ